jgi:glucokinase
MTTRPRKAVGIDIGGTKIALAAVDAAGAILGRAVIATHAERGFDDALSRMLQATDGLLVQVGWTRGELCGIGIGCTGPVSAQRGIINNPYTLPTWVECDIVSALSAEFDRPVTLENDADAAALGECYAGSGRGYRQVVMLTLGTGVGGGVVIDGCVYRGTHGEHPELGHLPVDAQGAACYCGTRGCLESIASGTAIAAAGREHGWSDSREVFVRADDGNAAAQAIVDRARWALGVATWTILHTFMPELIVLGGGVIDEHYERFASAAEEQIPRATMVPRDSTRVARALLGNDAGIVGAASLALRRAD